MNPPAQPQFDRAIFEAIPIPAFIVNEDVQILDLNEAAEKFCGQTFNMVFRRRGGEVLGCLHSLEKADGCGQAEACHGCVIRNSVKYSLGGNRVNHRLVRLQQSHGLEVKEIEVLVTASALDHQDEPAALLILEQIPGLSAMREPIPFCMHCKKVWDEEQYWMEVDAYLQQRDGLCFARALCPVCADNFVHPSKG